MPFLGKVLLTFLCQFIKGTGTSWCIQARPLTQKSILIKKHLLLPIFFSTEMLVRASEHGTDAFFSSPQYWQQRVYSHQKFRKPCLLCSACGKRAQREPLSVKSVLNPTASAAHTICIPDCICSYLLFFSSLPERKDCDWWAL